MSETLPRTPAPPLNPITGEPPGIREIMERRSAETEEPPAPPPEPTPPPKDDAEKAAAELARWKTRATEAEAQRSEAERARQAAERQAAQASQGAEDTGYTAVVTALGAAKGEATSLKAEMKTAGEAGDFGRVAEIAERLGQLGAEITELTRGQAEYERQREARLRQPPPAQPQISASSATERSILGQLNAPSRDAFIESRHPEVAAFLRANPEFFTDRAMFQRLIGADSLALGRGLELGSPKYMEVLRQEAGVAEPASSPTYRPPEAPQPPAAPQRQPPPPAAGPSREAPGPSGRVQTGDVYVSPEDKTAAEWLNVDPVEYAKEKQRLAARGEYPYRRR
jgi:hypothetical protein